jgi:hypothetical protein
VLRAVREPARAFAQRLAHQAQLAGLEVAQAAVQQLRGAAAGLAHQFAALEQFDAVPLGRELGRAADAIDAAADHGDVQIAPHACPGCPRRGCGGPMVIRGAKKSHPGGWL